MLDVEFEKYIKKYIKKHIKVKIEGCVLYEADIQIINYFINHISLIFGINYIEAKKLVMNVTLLDYPVKVIGTFGTEYYLGMAKMPSYMEDRKRSRLLKKSNG